MHNDKGQKTALVTGGAGFIGSHLVEGLLELGHKVIVLDNLCRGQLSNLKTVLTDDNLSIFEADVADFNQIRSHFKNVNWVFHMAALADIVPSIEEPLTYSYTNVDGTIAVLEAARLEGVEKFLYAASSSCYGLPDLIPTPETAEIRPMYPYALTKNIGEQYVFHWQKVYGLPCVSLRLFNVYGPRSRTNGTYGAVFGVFLAQKLANKPLTVVGDGTQTRDFTFVTDVVEAFIKACESNLQNETMNVGSGNTFSINYLVDLLGGQSVHIPKRPGEPDATFADTSKIRSLLDWEPKITFETGVSIMLDQIELWKDSPVWEESSIEAATTNWFKYLGHSINNQ